MAQTDDGWSIGSGQAAEAALLVALEKAAAIRFIDVGLPEVAAAEPTPRATLAAAAEERRLFVLRDPAGQAQGFALCDEKDGTAYLAELVVHPQAQGRRFGARLIEAAADWGRARGLAWLTLSTFRDVPWNGPYYRRLGFAPLPDADIGPALQAVREREAASGLDGDRREFLRRRL